ncbi:hypothetical protein HOL34_02125 [bacterium]|jgi:hypothetical protein|nr:hypothetical protein [bacterium]MBT3903696.1 hypothetical protein [bacterium]MBT4577582.1 hypothetical protein [bacterium]MBT5345742.1 hypothetical protein [bacterium]MBT6130917.1 hypothetical protein [bacterium]
MNKQLSTLLLIAALSYTPLNQALSWPNLKEIVIRRLECENTEKEKKDCKIVGKYFQRFNKLFNLGENDIKFRGVSKVPKGFVIIKKNNIVESNFHIKNIAEAIARKHNKGESPYPKSKLKIYPDDEIYLNYFCAQHKISLATLIVNKQEGSRKLWFSFMRSVGIATVPFLALKKLGINHILNGLVSFLTGAYADSFILNNEYDRRKKRLELALAKCTKPELEALHCTSVKWIEIINKINTDSKHSIKTFIMDKINTRSKPSIKRFIIERDLSQEELNRRLKK